ncbi:TetR/AcrR family transcriptional regulator [Halococcus salsus]|uniref:TetR/AcrR family transcriptional regulator n=1 Tax=Halococcus salsus TaxID=2162894 RepID=UPI001359F2D9|nr:TetR/AcrR family transcriptional regulator [Halococcus salsus]
MAADGDVDQRSETQRAIVEATYAALQTHGYADLTIQAIADEFEKSKSLLYYHYDTKDGLLIDVLKDGLDRFATRNAVDPDATPREQLETFLDRSLPARLDDETRAFRLTIFELRSQAPMNEAYREQFARADRLLHETLVEILERGIETGDFRDVDPAYTTDLLLSLTEGGMTRHLVTSDDARVATRDTLDTYVESTLLAD